MKRLLLLFSMLAISSCSTAENSSHGDSPAGTREVISNPFTSSAWGKKMLGDSSYSSSWKDAVLSEPPKSTWKEKMLDDSSSPHSENTFSKLLADPPVK